jgi:uncharacterized protein (DUF2062 family)
MFKLNKVIAFAFSNVSFPPFIPFILYASLKLGSFITGEELVFSMDEMTENYGFLTHLKTYLIGSITLASLAAVLLGLLSYLAFKFYANKKIVTNNG